MKDKKNIIWAVILYIFSIIHLGTLLYFIFVQKSLLGFNFIFAIPNTIMTLSKNKKVLFALNLVMFAIGLIFVVLRINNVLIK